MAAGVGTVCGADLVKTLEKHRFASFYLGLSHANHPSPLYLRRGAKPAGGDCWVAHADSPVLTAVATITIIITARSSEAYVQCPCVPLLAYSLFF